MTAPVSDRARWERDNHRDGWRGWLFLAVCLALLALPAELLFVLVVLYFAQGQS